MLCYADRSAITAFLVCDQESRAMEERAYDEQRARLVVHPSRSVDGVRESGVLSGQC